ncbi:MAG: putative manganese transporter [Mangrovibacterium sp.]
MNSFISVTLGQSVMITVFVLFMMVMIEYINVQTQSSWADKLRHNPFLQIVLAALLGISPGCLGAFTVVSLYTHRMMGLAGLVTVMIATSGDEAFVMFALFPGQALVLHVVLLLVAVVAGWVVYLFDRKNEGVPCGFVIHPHERCRCFIKGEIIPQLKKITFERSVALLAILSFIGLLTAGVLGPDKWDWKRITFLSGALFMLFVIVTVPEHFLKEHLYDHILKKHLVRIFLWTWAAFAVLWFVQDYLVLTDLLKNNTYWVLLIAVLVGIIPESGPHLIFVTLYAQQMLPFGILLANSIVQDGHGMLPLLAESRKDFLKVKLINMLVGLIVGIIFLELNF